MATVLDIMELYRAMTALLGPLESAFGRAWSIGTVGFPEWAAAAPVFFGEFTSRINSGNTAAPRRAAGFNGFNVLGGLGAFNQAIGLPERPVRPVRSDNGSFFYTGFGDKGAFKERGHYSFPEKIRGGAAPGAPDVPDDGFRSLGGAFVLPDYGANLGMVLDNQLIGKQISGIGAVLGDGGYSGEYGNYEASGENRGLLYPGRTLRTHPTLRFIDNPENGLVPNARTEEFDLWKNTEYLRLADSLKIGDDVLSGEPPEAVRSYAEREAGGYAGYRDFGSSSINIDMSSMKNIVNSKSDMDELIDRLCGAISEAAFSMAEGVHS